MRCCVNGCKNDSRNISKSQGITFHVFPIESSLRTAWLKAIGEENWEPKERSVVCSEHFLCGDLYETKNGLRKVKAGAVPVLQDSTSCSMYEDIPVLQVCRLCLSLDVKKLFSLKMFNFKRAYEDLTGFMLRDNERLPQTVCWECAARLLNHSRFRNRTLRANTILLEILDRQHQLTEKNLEVVKRETEGLISPLNVKYYKVNHYDLIVDEENKKEENGEAEEIKEEDKEQVSIDVAVKHESDNEIFINEAVQNDDDDNGAGDDADFVCRVDNYSSDDSLPLEQTRRKQKKLEKKKRVKVRKKQKPPPEPKIDRRRKPFLNDDLNETLFTITDLSHEEQVAEIEKRRESANYKNSVFKCTECYKGFLDEDAYKGHMTRHTDQCGPYTCEICKTHFKQPHALRKHVTAHHTQRFSCKQCPYITTHRQTARLHERWHKGTRYKCPHCDDEFVKFTTYMGHIRIKHPSDFVCELCGYSFVSAKGIELHKKLKHRLEETKVPEDGPFCELCNVRFISMEAHKRHLNVSARHNTGRENKPKKGRKSKETKEREKRNREKDSSDLDEKRKVYPSQLRKAEGPIPCEQCGLQLEDSRAYHSHFRRMHPDKNRTNYPSMKSPCMCEVCGRIFQSYALLKDHCWVHTGERPFKCDLCEKSFRMKQRLVAHRRVHAHARALYACALCGKNFSTHSNRQRHMFIHTGLKPFKCEMCGKGFKHASEKRAHITYVHLKKPWPKRARAKRGNDARQAPMLPHPSVAPSASEMAASQPHWADCDDQYDEMNLVIDEKRMYYNMKL